MHIEYSTDAQDDLARLPKHIRRRIIDKVTWFGAQEDPLDFAEPLRHPFHSLYRFRIGNYRAMFSLQGTKAVIIVVAIEHRKDVYR